MGSHGTNEPGRGPLGSGAVGRYAVVVLAAGALIAVEVWVVAQLLAALLVP